MHFRVFKEYWSNSYHNAMPKPYYSSNIEESMIEFYIPTFSDHDGSVKYHRIILKTVPVLDKKIFRNEADKLKSTHLLKPNGRIDSETIIVVAQQLSEEAKALRLRYKAYKEVDPKTKNTWFLRGRKTFQGYFEMPVIAREPERCLKRILVRLAKFYRERLTKFLEPYHLETLARKDGSWDRSESLWRIGKVRHYLLYTNVGDTGSIDYVEQQAVFCISKSIWWLNHKIRYIFGEVAKQSVKFRAESNLEALKRQFIGANLLNRKQEILDTLEKLKTLIAES
mgnify:CR=1 FL=1